MAESLSESKDQTESLSESKDRTSRLGALRKALWDVRANWKDIGIDLKIATGTLKVCIVRYLVIYIAVRILACMLQILHVKFIYGAGIEREGI